MNGRCEVVYTRQRWQLDHDAELNHESLFDADGEWRCPRASPDGADRCCFHQPDDRRPPDPELSRRLVAELRGDRELAAGHEPGELLAVDIDSLDLTTEATGATDVAEPSDKRRATEGQPSTHRLTLVGAEIDELVCGDALLKSDVILDGCEASEITVEGATLGEFSLATTHVAGPVTIDGRATSVDSVRLGADVRTERPVSIGDSAVVHEHLSVEGDRIDVPSIVIDTGARVGLDGDASGPRPGVTFTDVHEPDTDLLVRGGETTVAGITLRETRLGSAYVQKCPGVQDAIRFRDAILDGNLQIEGTTADPELILTGNGTAVNSVTVRNSFLETMTVEAGATATAIRLTGPETTVTNGVELTDAGTAADTIHVDNESTVSTGLWIQDGALLREGLTIDDATVTALGRLPEKPGLRVTDGRTRIGAVTISEARVEGISLGRATVEGEVRVEQTELTHPTSAGRPDSGADSSEDRTTAVLQVADTTIGGITLDGGTTTGAITIDHATVRHVAVQGDATFQGPVTVRDETTIDTSITVAGTPSFSAPLTLTGGTTLGGDLQLRAEGGTATFDCTTGINLDGSQIVGDVRVEMGLVAGTDVVRIDNAAVDGAVAAAGAQLDGDLVIRGGSVIGRDLELAAGTVVGAVSLTDAAVVRGSVSLEDATADAIELDDARVHRRLQLLGGTTVAGPVLLERDATIGGDLIVGNTSAPTNDRTTVEGTIRLGDRRDAHPMSGGVSIDGSFALTGTARVEGGTRMSDVVVGEDLHVVGERATASIGAVDLFDCIVRGKVHVEGGELGGLSLRECRVGESVWIGSVDTGRERALGAVDDDRETDERSPLDQKTDREEPDNEPVTAVSDGVTIVATPVGENVLVRSARLGGLTLKDTAVSGRVDIDVVVIEGALRVSDSTIGERARVGAGSIGSISVDESAIEQRLQIGAGWRVDADRDPPPEPDEEQQCLPPESDQVAGAVTVEQSTIHGGLTMDCHVTADETSVGPAVVDTDVRGSVRLRPRLDAAGGVDLHGTTLPAGTVVITTPAGAAERCWYDLRGATLGDVSVEFDEGDGSAVDQLLLLDTRYDGFRFSDVPGGIAGGKLHLLGDRNLTDTVPDIPAADGRIGPNATTRHRLGRALSRLPLVGTGYRDDDPPPSVLERTYLNAKNGASQVGEEDVAGTFFTLEKRYRRRRLWETVAGVDNGVSTRHTGSATIDWLWNAIFDRMAVYGESPGRVVTVSGAVIALFSVFFAVLLDQPPYGDQYLGSGILPDWVALGLQPLTLSIESFVTLVLVGPASQRLTPLVHLLGQIEGFFGVFLVALFVFTLTRSVHR